MPNPFPNPLTFYPSYCYPLSPTYNTWVRLTAADVHALRERVGYEGTRPSSLPTKLEHLAAIDLLIAWHSKYQADNIRNRAQGKISIFISTTP